ncbi:hypothetical protein [Phormidium sp. CCY1219]|uniref:hypothetical protein n=1 Tax=Phormidium sp. CCY1219 TaxID=2886104 RepID=UPI002D1E9A3C|nr:hypothetical protein [Phormidium sp. CCY1219]MEB3830164.1 hypothetical protein [Phormidium sp. CCY1219]
MSQQQLSYSSVDIFLACHNAIAQKVLIQRVSRKDKEFHFQNWFEERLKEATIDYEQQGRNSYPDFTLVETAEGYEVKGLGFPGREADYDCNSQVPIGYHNGRVIYYVFGSYSSAATENEYPVIDLVICHGDFLNADREYVHKNKSFTGFGSYGDLKIRDRKMYIAPTPYGLVRGADRQITLILPEYYGRDSRLEVVGQLTRVEADRLVIGYSFDLTTNQLTPRYQSNPSAGQIHSFIAYRAKGIGGPTVALKNS